MYKIKGLQECSLLIQAFSTIVDGNMSLVINKEKVSPEKVIENRKRFFKKAGIDINRTMTIWLRHGNKVVEAKEKWLGKTILNKIDPPKADAVITDKKNTFLSLTVADCVPIVIYDPKKGVVGLVHAGWKGIDNKIVVKTIKKMGEKFNTSSKDLVVGIGPCIDKKDYIKLNFPEKYRKSWGEFAEDMGHGFCSIDLKGFIFDQLIKIGLKKQNIHDSGVNVFEDKRFFSRTRDVQSREGDRGRFLVVVGMAD